MSRAASCESMQRWFNDAYHWIWSGSSDANRIADSAPNAESASDWLWVVSEFALTVLNHQQDCKARLTALSGLLSERRHPENSGSDVMKAGMKEWFKKAYQWIWYGRIDALASVDQLAKVAPDVALALDWLWAAGDFARVVLLHDRECKYRMENLQRVLRQEEAGSKVSLLLSAEQELSNLKKSAHAMSLEIAYRESFAQTYASTLKFEVVAFQVLDPSPMKLAALREFKASQPTPPEEIYVYHCAPAAVIPLIVDGGLRPSHCEFCRGLRAGICPDAGWFGDHTKGVYVSRHGDYTAKYFRSPPRAPADGDVGRTVMCLTALGRTKRLTVKTEGAPPDGNVDCHVSPNGIEYFMYDSETQAEPPRHLSRCVPVAVIHWRAVNANLVGITDEGA